MQIELPSGPAGGAACLDKDCISPTLSDLFTSALDVGDARDEEQFQQKVHALPSPAGTAFSQQLAAVQVRVGVFMSHWTVSNAKCDGLVTCHAGSCRARPDS